MKRTMRKEPDFQTACQWWTDLQNIWTPVGWKDHLFRFNVLWNGTILAEPNLNRRTEQWKDQGAQLKFARESLNQGWNDGPAPVLWTDYSVPTTFTLYTSTASTGVLCRQEVFAHIPGGGDVRTGTEPLFAWVRVSVRDLVTALPLPNTVDISILINAPHLYTNMDHRQNLRVIPELSRYPRSLSTDRLAYEAGHGLRILEEDGRVRLGVAAHQACKTRFSGTDRVKTHYLLEVRLKTKKGAHVDVLVPMLPTERKVFDRELALGYDAALKEANRYWAKQPKTDTKVSVPEPFINEAVKHSVRFSQIIAEKNPATGKYCKLSGSWTYSNLWATPLAMELIMMMDTLGYHDFAGRYLEIFREEQGTVVPPGNAYRKHPGYLSTPALYKSMDWLSDNGAILYALSMHALLSGDHAFIQRFTDTIVKSCEWIKEARALKGHGGYEGILPAAVATDRHTRIQALWSDGWNYKGLCAAVRLLNKIRHPRAAEFAREAETYRAAFIKALRDKCRKMPTWRDACGQRHTLVPTALFGDKRDETMHAFYLDVGPLFLVFTGLLDANDPLMEGTLKWFREGPQRKHYCQTSNCWQMPVLDHEMSSCEPMYSWNVFHSWQTGNREKFLEGMYSQFAGALSRKTYISCETRGGITGLACAASLSIWLARLAVLDDQLKKGELHLLRLMPLAWLKPGEESVFEKMPTEFGPVTLKTRVSRDEKTLEVVFKPEFRAGPEPKRIVLHVPPVPKLQRVFVNGKAYKGRVITLTRSPKEL